MGQALYRKYRSTSLSEIVGQEHITTALEQALKTGRISHAYLFTGPRGTGKTSLARILAHAINDLPYSSEAHLDIIEIDAASNRRIDEIRDLRDKVYVAPTSAKYKVYIIDEVHMLTREAFNALLKTLEEPPAHVVFILATTDVHKLPETIISRTQRYTLRPVDQEKVVKHLAHIAKSEKITADNDALELLAKHGEGTFRDSISLLDQASNQGEGITLEGVRSQLGIPSETAITEIIDSLTDTAISAPITRLQKLYSNGYRAGAIAEQLAAMLREQLTNNSSTLPAATSLQLLKRLLDVPGAHNPERLLEIILMEVIVPASPPPTTAPVTAAAPKPVAPPTPKPVTVVTPEPKVTENLAPTQPDPIPEPAKVGPPSTAILDDESWVAVLSELKKQYNTLYGIVRMAHTDFSEPGTVQLSFSFAFHQKRINDAKNRKIVSDCIAVVTGQQVSLVCTVSKEPKARPAVAPVKDASLQDISAVFGGGELL
jgi:DNA polymerase-3 subunit gamma/tau